MNSVDIKKEKIDKWDAIIFLDEENNQFTIAYDGIGGVVISSNNYLDAKAKFIEAMCLSETVRNIANKNESIISDPNNILTHKSMDMYAKKGHKVTVTDQTINWGRDYDKEKANKYLEVGKVYTVKTTWVYDFSSTVELEEFPNEKFNTVHFIDYKE